MESRVAQTEPLWRKPKWRERGRCLHSRSARTCTCQGIFGEVPRVDFETRSCVGRTCARTALLRANRSDDTNANYFGQLSPPTFRLFALLRRSQRRHLELFPFQLQHSSLVKMPQPSSGVSSVLSTPMLVGPPPPLATLRNPEADRCVHFARFLVPVRDVPVHSLLLSPSARSVPPRRLRRGLLDQRVSFASARAGTERVERGRQGGHNTRELRKLTKVVPCWLVA